jgi:hypothetical protein
MLPVAGQSALKAEVMALLREAVDAGALPSSAVVVVDGVRHSIPESQRDMTTVSLSQTSPSSDGLISPDRAENFTRIPLPPPRKLASELRSPERSTSPPENCRGQLSLEAAASDGKGATLYGETRRSATASAGRSSVTPHETLHTDRFFAWLDKRNSKLDIARQKSAIQRETDPECTFRPEITASRKSYRGGHVSKDMLTRMQEWDIQRQRRIGAARAAKDSDTLAECTFEPSRLPVSKGGKELPAHNGEYRPGHFKVSDPSVALRQEALTEMFLARQLAAREKAARIKSVTESIGKKYTGKITRPESPALATSQRSRSQYAFAGDASQRSTQASTPRKQSPRPAPVVYTTPANAAVHPANLKASPTVVMLPSGEAVLISPGAAPVPVSVVSATTTQRLSPAASSRSYMSVSPTGVLVGSSVVRSMSNDAAAPLSVDRLRQQALLAEFSGARVASAAVRPERRLPMSSPVLSPISARLHAAPPARTQVKAPPVPAAMPQPEPILPPPPAEAQPEAGARLRRELQHLLSQVHAAFDAKPAADSGAYALPTRQSAADQLTMLADTIFGPPPAGMNPHRVDLPHVDLPSSMAAGSIDDLLRTYSEASTERLQQALGAIGTAALPSAVSSSAQPTSTMSLREMYTRVAEKAAQVDGTVHETRSGRTTPTKPAPSASLDSPGYTNPYSGASSSYFNSIGSGNSPGVSYLAQQAAALRQNGHAAFL